MRISDWSSDVCSYDLIRSEIWLKAWGNLSFNPISALTHATLEDICTFPETRKLAATMMAEAQQIAEKLGVTFRHTIDRSEEHTSELQSLMRISYAVFCLKKKNTYNTHTQQTKPHTQQHLN